MKSRNMKKEKFYSTKLGNEFLIREAKLSDSKKLIECVKSYLKSNFIPITKEEYNEFAIDNEKWMSKLINDKNNLLLVAEFDSKIIGNIDLTMSKHKMLSHTGLIGMGVVPVWQNQGVGTKLIENVIDWGIRNPEIEILWLQVFGNNLKGISLYKKMGFIINGNQKGFIKNQKGEYIDNVFMFRDTKG